MECMELSASDFDLERHAAYFKSHMEKLPGAYKSMDTNRLTLLYFAVSGLDLLGMLGLVDRERTIRFIYSYQSPLADNGGFYGYPRVEFSNEERDRCNNQPHIANTYVALVMLIILGDDLSRVNREAIAESLRKWQLSDGSFCCVHGVSRLDSESDMRFVFCAAAICYILDLWHAVDVDGMFTFIASAQSYDRGFGMGPNTEAHGGCTYCALAALTMMGRLYDLAGKEELIDWCIKRQLFGFQGRIEKDMDSCYSFWVGGSLKLLGAGGLMHGESCARFIKSCESTAMGGFQKFPQDRVPDLLHSYFSVCGLCLCGVLQPLNATLNMSERAFSSAAARFRQAPGGRPWSPPHQEAMLGSGGRTSSPSDAPAAAPAGPAAAAAAAATSAGGGDARPAAAASPSSSAAASSAAASAAAAPSSSAWWGPRRLLVLLGVAAAVAAAAAAAAWLRERAGQQPPSSPEL